MFEKIQELKCTSLTAYYRFYGTEVSEPVSFLQNSQEISSNFNFSTAWDVRGTQSLELGLVSYL